MDVYLWVGIGIVVLLAVLYIASFFIRVDPRIVKQISSDSGSYRNARLPLDPQTRQYLGNDDLDNIQDGPKP